MKFIKTQIIALLILFGSVQTYPQVGLDKLAQSTMNFLMVSTSPKSSAMGDAYFAVGKGADAIFYNPAGMTMNGDRFDISLNYTQWIADINYLSAALSYQWGNIGRFGVHVLTVDYGDIIGTRLVDPSMQNLYPSGYIETGLVNNVGAYSFGISYAKAITEQFSIGGNVRLAGQNLGENQFIDGTSADNSATKFVFDAGVMYQTSYKKFRFGMALRNFASSIKREAIEEQLPLSFTLGAAINLLEFFKPPSDEESITLAFDFMHSNHYSERLNAGLEYRFISMLSLRAGYSFNHDLASWSAGFGINTSLAGNYIELNYSYSAMDIFDNINRFSLKFAM